MKPFFDPETINPIDENFPSWETQKINGSSINELLVLENIPIWWFYKRLLTLPVIPKQFNISRVIPAEKPSRSRSLYMEGCSFLMRNYFYYIGEINILFSRKWSMQKKGELPQALFLTYTNHYNPKTGDVFRLGKIIHKIKEDKKYLPLILVAAPLSTFSYDKIGNSNHTVYGFVEKEDTIYARKKAQQLLKNWEIFDKAAIFGQAWYQIKPMLNLFFSYDFFYNLALYYRVSRKILSNGNINVIVLSSKNGFFERCLMAAAYNLSIPVIIVQHGEGLGIGAQEVFPNVKFAVFGDINRQRLLAQGIAADNIFVTGPIIFDEIVNYKNLKPAGQQGEIAIITAPLIKDHWMTKRKYFALLSKVLNAAKRLGKPITLKLHPRENNWKDYQRLCQKLNLQQATIITAAQETTLYELLSKADLVINFYSTVALEAMILDKPVLTVDLGPAVIPNVEKTFFMGTKIVKIEEDIPLAISELLKNNYFWRKKREEAVKLYCDKIDGKAHERLVKIIYSLAKDKTDQNR